MKSQHIFVWISLAFQYVHPFWYHVDILIKILKKDHANLAQPYHQANEESIFPTPFL